jgi:carboxylesterase
MSTRLPVRGVIAMSTPSRLPSDYPLWFFQLVSLVLKYRPKSREAPGSGWFDKAAYREHIAYPQNPVRSVAELKKLMLAMNAALPKVQVPVLLMHSRDDKYVSAENIERIYSGLSQTLDKTKLYFSGSGHNLPRDASREQVFQSAIEFIQRIHNS